MAQDDAAARLAKQIDATRKAERLLTDLNTVTTLRRNGAADLHRICAEFVSSVNGRLSEPVLELSPVAYAPESFRDSGVNLIRISSQGREIQITFEAPSERVSTEKFAIPYILEGEIRAYNQRMLEKFHIRSQTLFLCVESETAVWRFYDWRTRRTGPFGPDLLASLMEPLF